MTSLPESLPQELLVTILHLVDLRSVLVLTSVSKHLNKVIERNFDEEYWTTLSIELFGFKPLRCPKSMLVKAVRVRANILSSRFSCFRFPCSGRLTDSLDDSVILHNNSALFNYRTLPTFEQIQAPGHILHVTSRYMTNIASLYYDQNSALFALLVNGRSVEIPKPNTDHTDIQVVGNIVVFNAMPAHIDISVPPDSEKSGLHKWLFTSDVSSCGWSFRGYFTEGLCLTDRTRSRWKIVPWDEVPMFSFEFNSGYNYLYAACKSFVCLHSTLPPPALHPPLLLTNRGRITVISFYRNTRLIFPCTNFPVTQIRKAP
jgi:hypothetical protein